MRQRLYNGPDVPTAYDPAWPLYTNLTQAQVAIFQTFPEDLLKYAKTKRWQKETAPLDMAGMSVDMNATSQAKIAALKQAFDNGTLTGTVHFSALDGVHVLTASDVSGLYSAMLTRVQDTYTAFARLSAGIFASPPTVTVRGQIDATYDTIG